MPNIHLTFLLTFVCIVWEIGKLISMFILTKFKLGNKKNRTQWIHWEDNACKIGPNRQISDCNRLKSPNKCLICHLVANTAANQVTELFFCVNKIHLSLRTLKYLKELCWVPSCSSSTWHILQYLDQNYLQMFFVGSFIIGSDLSTCAGGCKDVLAEQVISGHYYSVYLFRNPNTQAKNWKQIMKLTFDLCCLTSQIC